MKSIDAEIARLAYQGIADQLKGSSDGAWKQLEKELDARGEAPSAGQVDRHRQTNVAIQGLVDYAVAMHEAGVTDPTNLAVVAQTFSLAIQDVVETVEART
jgi:hypothetical protein